MHRTLPQMVFDRIDHFGPKPVMRRKIEKRYQDLSWQELGNKITAFATGLLALEFKTEQQAAILAPNSPEWAAADLAIMSIGGRTVPIYHTEGRNTILHILADSESRVLFIHSQVLARQILEAREQCPLLQKIILLEGHSEHPDILELDNFLTQGEQIDRQRVEQLLQAGQTDALATLVYTSGTTGKPKGAMLSHANILSNINACCRRFEIGPQDQCLSFLPLSHIFERMAGYYLMLQQGATIAYAESIATVTSNLLEIQPTILISIPRLYEKMHSRVLERVTTGPWLKKQLFFLALRIGKAKVTREQQGLTATRLQTSLARLFDRLVFSKIKARLGGRLRLLISGGAPLAKEIAEFFLATGVTIYEGYGMTETSPVIAVNYPGQLRLGSVGPLLDNTKARLAADGELLVKGPGVFRGYWNKPQQSSEVLQDGWLHTGDVATLDNDGFLAITDRKKDIIVTAGGKNIAPQELENRLKADKYISNVMVYGDKKPYLTALVVPDFESLQSYAKYKKIDVLDLCSLINHPQILFLLSRRIDRSQQAFPAYHQIKRFTLLQRDFSGDKEEVTPTLKIKRDIICKRYARVLEDLYRSEAEPSQQSSFCITNLNTGVEIS